MEPVVSAILQVLNRNVKQPPLSFSNCPPELLQRIFSLLSNRNFLNCREVSNHWMQASNAPICWKMRVFTIVVQPTQMPPLAQFFTPPGFDQHHWKSMRENCNHQFVDIEKALEAGLPDAQCEKARRILKESQYTDAEALQAVELLLKASQQDHPKAQWRLSKHYRKSHNWEEVWRWCSRAANNGLANAQISIGANCENSTYRVLWLQLAANQGHPEAIARLADAYKLGDGVEKNPSKAQELYLQAAERVNKPGKLCWKGHLFDAAGNTEEALKWYTKAAEQGDVPAMRILGQHFEEEKNFTEAFKWYLKIAEWYEENRGDHYNDEANEALGTVADYYARGQGVEQNYSKALKWFRFQAKEFNWESAQYKVGLYYKNGCGTEPNPRKAVKWFERASKEGGEYFYKADFELAICYAEGIGVPVDLEKAKEYIRQAEEKSGISCEDYKNRMQERIQIS